MKKLEDIWNQIPAWARGAGGVILTVGMVAFGALLNNRDPRLLYEPIQSEKILTHNEQDYYTTQFHVWNAGRVPLSRVIVRAEFAGTIEESSLNRTTSNELLHGQLMGLELDMPINDDAEWIITSTGPIIEDTIEIRSNEILGKVDKRFKVPWQYVVTVFLLGAIFGIFMGLRRSKERNATWQRAIQQMGNDIEVRQAELQHLNQRIQEFSTKIDKQKASNP